MIRTHHRRLAAAAVALSLAATASVAAVAPSLAALPPCHVKNLGTNVTKSSLQAAVTAASGGATLLVTGTCLGGTTINKNLTIIGKQTATTGKPTLDGNATRVVWVRVGRQVSINGLTIRDGMAEGAYPDNSGGGIRNDGTLTLTNVIVRDNDAYNGGGISTSGTLILKGATRIAYNHADSNDGGGVDVDSTDRNASMVMNDTSSVDHNSARWGGGVNIWVGTLTMNDRASIHHNSADHGAGVMDQGHLTMTGSTNVHDNRVRSGDMGAGVEIKYGDGPNGPTFTMKGASRVQDNIAGASGAGVLLATGCGGPDPVISGLSAIRLIDNVPTDEATTSSC